MADIREQLCAIALRLYQQGLAHGSTGNISVRLETGDLLVTPTGSSFATLVPEELSVLDSQGRWKEGHKPTKEVPLHQAFYETRAKQTGAVVHLHSCHATALSLVDQSNPDHWLPPLTPYSVMQLGAVKLLPYFMPGDPAVGDAIRGLAGKHSAVMLANHGPVVAGQSLDAAAHAMEELEATSRLVLLTRGMNPRGLSNSEVDALIKHYSLD